MIWLRTDIPDVKSFPCSEDLSYRTNPEVSQFNEGHCYDRLALDEPQKHTGWMNSRTILPRLTSEAYVLDEP